MSKDHSSNLPDDPVLLHARRELSVILIVFCICLLWTVPFCYLNGYNQPTDGEIAKVLGIPSWIFWGVTVPWLCMNVFTCWFCFFFMANDNLGEDEDITKQDPAPETGDSKSEAQDD